MPWLNHLRRRPSLEIRVPISPKALFFNRIHYLAASLAENAGPYRDTRITVVIGDDADEWDVSAELPWSRKYPIRWHWMPRELYQQDTYFATRLVRYTLPAVTDVVLMLDADVMCAGPIDDLIRRVRKEGRLLGVPANATPVRAEFTWERLFELADLGSVPYVAEHSGFGCTFDDEEQRFCPPYFNFGVLPMPAQHCEVIGESVFDELRLVRQVEDFFVGQMSTTLALVRNRLPWGTMPFKYNFVNDERYLPRYQADFDDLRILHYLDNQSIHKDRSFESIEAVESVLAQGYDLEVDRRFVELLGAVHRRVLRDL